MKDNDILYSLKLHECAHLSEYWTVMRVPGGWLYRSLEDPPTLAFVPFDNEFQCTEKSSR